LRRHDGPRSADGVSAPPRPRRHGDPSGHVALLAATALGFAYAPTGDEETQARRLATLADAHLEVLSRAQAAVLTLEIGCAHARMRAAALLRQAARYVVGPCGAGLRGDRGTTGPLALRQLEVP
jgi:hypothetical protein